MNIYIMLFFLFLVKRVRTGSRRMAISSLSCSIKKMHCRVQARNIMRAGSYRRFRPIPEMNWKGRQKNIMKEAS